MKIDHFLSASALSISFLFTSSAYAISQNTWNDISNVGVYSLLGTALILPAARKDWQGFRQASYSIGSAYGVTFVTKQVFPEQRPDKSGNDSFPSGHATNAFSSATTLYRRYGWEVGLPAYALATLTGISRVKADKHHWYDVAIGAAIGSASGWYFTDVFDNKVQLLPWADTHGAGLIVSMRF